MLLSLYAKNLILVEELQIDFEKHLTVVTGETGSGKSLIINSIDAIFAKSLSKNLVRPKANNATIIAVFESNKQVDEILTTQSIELSPELHIKKIIDETGKTKAYLNNEVVTQKLLSEIGEYLVEIHGQNDQHGLLNEKNHLAILDDFCHLNSDLIHLKEAFLTLKSKRAELEKLEKLKLDGDITFSQLKKTAKELSTLNLQANDYENLLEKRSQLRNIGSTKEHIERAYGIIVSKNLNSSLNEAIRTLSKISSATSSKINNLLKLLENSYQEIEEAVNVFESLKNDFNHLETLEEIESKLFLISELSRKNNTIPEELYLLIKNINEQILFFDNLDLHISNAKKELATANKKYLEIATKVSTIRQEKAKRLENIINAELKDLKMPHAFFKVDIKHLSQENYNEFGIEKIEFLIKTNNLSDFGKIGKIASGGELSRLMLAIKLALKETKNVDLMIFDEIDTGISGAVSDAVGRKLKELTKTVAQVICITHQPQIASYADNHILVSKEIKENSTFSKLQKLENDSRVEEIARMLAGNVITNEAIANAKAMINLGKVN